MTTDIFKRRGQALEEAFFRKVDAELTEKLRQKLQHEREVAELKEEIGIQDDGLVEELLQAGIHPGMIRVLTLVPAIEVAWANGFLEKEEREAVKRAAKETGIAEETPAGHLLASWLEEKPGPQLFNAWKDYVAALRDVLDRDSYLQLQENAVRMARHIAEVAGGILGINAVSDKEKAVIQKIEEAFHAS